MRTARRSTTSRRPSAWVAPTTRPSTCGSASSGHASASTRRRSPRSRPRRPLPRPTISPPSRSRSEASIGAEATWSRPPAISTPRWRRPVFPTRSGHAASSSGAWSRSGPATSGHADEAASAARDLATRVGDPHLAGVAERIVGLVAQSRGDSAAARAALERSVAMAADDPDVTASIAATTALALDDRRRGRGRRGHGARRQRRRGVPEDRRPSPRGRGREPPRRPAPRSGPGRRSRWST